MKINHAALHVVDAQSAVNVLSQRELSLDSRATRSFVTKHLRRARTSPENLRGSFGDDSAFAQALKGYFFGEVPFEEISRQIGEFVSGELGRAEKPESTDILVADFEDDEDARWFAVLLLTSRMAFMHEVVNEGGVVANEIRRHYAILPNPSQKLASYALVRSSSLEVLYRDKPRTIAGEERMLIPDGLLQCEAGVSAAKIMETVTRVVAEAAEEHGANTAVALAMAKAAMVEKVEESEELPPWDVVDEAFEDEPAMREAVHRALEEERVPERVPVERSSVKRSAVRNQKIRTDTGIEITFPAEMGGNSDYIEFVNAPNGLISIELKNIGSIESR